MKPLNLSVQQGFTLIEVLVALAIVGAAMLSLLALLAGSYRQQYHMTHLMRATHLGESVLLEGLLAAEVEREALGQQQDYYWQRQQEKILDSHKQQLTVTVSWDELGGIKQRFFSAELPATHGR